MVSEKSEQDLEKKKRNKPHRGHKWVGWDKRVFKTYNLVKFFLAYLKPFLDETAFYAEVSKRFSGPKTKVT